MKTYLLTIPSRLKLKSQSLDSEAILCNKTWTVFNDENVRQLFIFLTDGTLYITTNGIVSNSSWRYVPANGSIVIKTESISLMFHPVFLDNIVFALQQDGTSNCLFMIDEENQKFFQPRTLTELGNYFKQKETFLANEEKRLREVQRINQIKYEREEKERQEREKRELERKQREDNERDDLIESILLWLFCTFVCSYVIGILLVMFSPGTTFNYGWEGILVASLPTGVVIAIILPWIKKILS